MPRLGVARLIRRQLAADRGAAFMVALVVLLVGGLLAAWPRAIDHVLTEDLADQIEELPPTVRGVIGNAGLAPPSTSAGGPTADGFYAGIEATMADIWDEAPAAAKPHLGAPGYQVLSPSFGLADAPARYSRGTYVRAVMDPHYKDRIELVDGTWPEGVGVTDDPEVIEAARQNLRAQLEMDAEADGENADHIDNVVDETDLRPRVIDIMVSVRTAQRYEWVVGETRALSVGPGGNPEPVFARLTGTFEPADPDDDYWAHTRAMLEPDEPIDGDGNAEGRARGFVAPSAVTDVMMGPELQMPVWIPLEAAGLRAGQAPELLDAMRAMTSDNYPVEYLIEPDEQSAGGAHGGAAQLTVLALRPIEETLDRHGSALALLGLVAAGPFGVAVAVLALGARLIVERRRRAMSLVVARGASRRQLRTVLFVEGLLIGVPAAALAVAAARWFVPGDGGLAGILLPAVIGLAPALLLPTAVRSAALREGRTDLGRRARKWWRWAVEALVIGAAVAAAVVVNQRGTASGEGRVEPDLLLISTPLLVALAVCVVVLRIYPLPVRLISRYLRNRSGVVGFVGTLRAVRDPAAGLAPVLALVIGLSVAIFSTSLWSTTEAAGASESVLEVGADLRVEGTFITDEARSAIEAMPEVSGSAALASQTRVETTVGDQVSTPEVFTFNADDLAAVQAGLSDVAAIPDGMAELSDGRVPAIASPEVGPVGGVGVVERFGGLDIEIISTPDRVAGVPADDPWIMIDERVLDALGFSPRDPRVLLLSGENINTEAIGEMFVGEGGEPLADMSSAEGVLDDVRAGPLGTGLVTSFVTAVVVVGVLSVLAVVVTMLIGAPSRGRLFSQLRTLGLSGRQAHAMAIWEMAPLVLVALAFGVGLGIGLPWVSLSAVDLRPLTGSTEQPATTLDLALIGGAVGVFVGVVVVAVSIAVASSRRLRLGSVLRVGEEV